MAKDIWTKQFACAQNNCVHVQQGHRPGAMGAQGRELQGAADCWLNRYDQGQEGIRSTKSYDM